MSQATDKNFPPNGWVLWVLSLDIKRLGHKADHSAPSTATIKNEQSHTSTSIYASMVWRGTLPSCWTSFFLWNSTTDPFILSISCWTSRYYTSHTCAVHCVPKLCGTLCTLFPLTPKCNWYIDTGEMSVIYRHQIESHAACRHCVFTWVDVDPLHRIITRG